METRLIVAYSIIALVALGAAVFAWWRATRAARLERKELAVRARWLGGTRPPPAPLPGDLS